MLATTRPVAGSTRWTPASLALVAKVPHRDPAPTAMTLPTPAPVRTRTARPARRHPGARAVLPRRWQRTPPRAAHAHRHEPHPTAPGRPVRHPPVRTHPLTALGSKASWVIHQLCPQTQLYQRKPAIRSAKAGNSRTSPGRTLLANLRAVGLGDLLWSGVHSGAHQTPEAVNDDDVATVRPCGPGKHGAGGAGGVPEGMPSDPDP